MIFFCICFKLRQFFLFWFLFVFFLFVLNLFSGGLETYIDPAGNTGNAGLDHL